MHQLIAPFEKQQTCNFGAISTEHSQAWLQKVEMNVEAWLALNLDNICCLKNIGESASVIFVAGLHF